MSQIMIRNPQTTEKLLQHKRTSNYFLGKNKAALLHYPNETLKKNLISNIFKGNPPDQYLKKKP
jgi:hypothetical protein